MTTITLTTEQLNSLDLAPAETVLDPLIEQGAIASTDLKLRFEIRFDQDSTDPRELSEIPEVRLWFVRLDARYPWLPYVLDWEAELGRYAAMLVPHQFNPSEGIQYNPEALELFVMNKVFVLMDWTKQHQVFSRTKLKFITQLLGYELDDAFFNLFPGFE